MRSNDIVYGFCNDVYCFSLFQQMMLNELNEMGADVELGYYHHFANSMHIYKKHFGLQDKIIHEGPSSLRTCKTKLKPDFVWENIPPLPSEDMSKDDIIEFSALVFTEVIEYEYPRKSQPNRE